MDKQQKLILLAAVAGLSAVGLLFLLRRRYIDEGFDEYDVKGSNENHEEFVERTTSETVASASESLIKVNVPQYCVGPLIGKGGENIRHLRKETGTRIDFERELKDDDNFKKKDRILEIRGEREKVLNAEIKINQLISEVPKVTKSEMFVPDGACGIIIGKKGNNIRELVNASGAKITIEPNEDRNLEGLRKVLLQGTPQQIEYAKGLIQEKVEQVKVSKKFKSTSRRARQRSPSPASRTEIPVSKLPTTGGFFRVFVSAFDIPDHFYVQLVTKEGQRLDDLNTKMTDYYGNVQLSQGEVPPSKVALGEIYCAPFDLDDLWYRGNVIEVKEEEKAAVLFYIDYGDVGLVQLDDLRKPKPEFLQLDAQAIECFLANIKPNGEKWSEESIDRFQELSHCSQWSELMARVVGFREDNGEKIPCLELIDTNLETEINIAQMLIKEGYAVESNGSTARSESQLQVIREDAITETPNNNVMNMTSTQMLPEALKNNEGLTTSSREVLKNAENGNRSIGNPIYNENVSAIDAVFDESVSSVAEPELPSNVVVSPGKVSFLVSRKPGEEPKGTADGQSQGSFDANQSSRGSAGDISVSSSSTEDTIVNLSGRGGSEYGNTEGDRILSEQTQDDKGQSPEMETVQLSNSHAPSQVEVVSEVIENANDHVAKAADSEVQDRYLPEVDGYENIVADDVTDAQYHAGAPDANDSGVDLETVNFEPNFKKSVTEEVSRWMEKSYEESSPLETILEDTSVDNNEKNFTPSLTSSGVSSVTASSEANAAVGDASGSPKRYRFQESMEIARENPVMVSDDEDSMTYFSARSEQTIASDNDTLSFRSAPDTPTNIDDEFQFPSKDESTLDYDIITTPVGSDDEKMIPDIVATPVTTKSSGTSVVADAAKISTPGSKQTPKYQIAFIDESGKQKAKVMSASMENIPTAGKDRLSASPQRVGQLSTSTPQFGELQNSESRFGGSGSLFGKETAI